MLRNSSVLAALLLSLATVGFAKDRHVCSLSDLEGDWALTVTGTVFLPNGMSVPLATVGRLTFDNAGNMSATQTNSVGGAVSPNEAVRGSVNKINADCTGTFTVSVYDPSGSLLRTAVFNFVVAASGSELRAIATSLMRGGVSVAPVLTFHATNLFRDNCRPW